MRLDRFVTLSLVSPLMRMGALRPKPGIPVLMYHSVSDADESGVPPYYRLATSPARFREQMQSLVENGYRTVSLADAFCTPEAHETTTPRAVVTFDDGFRDFITHAWPVLDDLGLTATVFLPTDFIDRHPGAFKGRECLTWSEVRYLQERGISFGSHTASHPTLYGLAWDTIRRELAESKSRLEDELQVPIETFAYPFAFPQEDAAFVARFSALLEDVGYRVGVTTMIGRASARTNPLCIPRLPVNECDDQALLSAKLSGAYDWLSDPQRVQRSVSARIRSGRRRPSHLQ